MNSRDLFSLYAVESKAPLCPRQIFLNPVYSSIHQTVKFHVLRFWLRILPDPQINFREKRRDAV